MDHFYQHATLPPDQKLLDQINDAAEVIDLKLSGLDPDSLDISDYNKRYLTDKLRHLKVVIPAQTYILAWALAGLDKPLDEVVLVDYGGGIGILSMLARELGVGTVVYNDIYDVSCRDAQRIAERTDAPAHAYVQGDLEDLMLHLSKENLSADTITSYDVIEHIYDLDAWLSDLRRLTDGRLRVFFGSGANTHNPIIKRRMVKAQISVENEDRTPTYGHKERDSLRSYRNIRKDILREADPTLHPDALKRIAEQTRGLVKDDILAALAEYQNTGRVSYEPDHPTNTCDPLTGNWAEHLMDTQDLKHKLEALGYDARVLCGFYSGARDPLKALIHRLLNIIISRLGEQGVVLTPDYFIYGDLRG